MMENYRVAIKIRATKAKAVGLTKTHKQSLTILKWTECQWTVDQLTAEEDECTLMK